MEAQKGIRSKLGARRGTTALTRASAVACALAIALGMSGGATAQEPSMPYGWHDGNAGVVTTAWQCSAYGWAVDPEDPDRDLQIQIFADGNPVATTVADQLREDVTDCPGGSCGFGVNLWGLITPGVEHLITAQAYDEETLTWVDLSGTPKPLTCWGYPEGFHDGAAGLVDQYGCAATGWTADPDDRDRDLQVQILADGNPVTTVTADVLREDVGACVGGTCGFFADLWGLIDPDVEHAITAQAYDEESGQWLNLEATPKSLTCQAAPPPTPSIWISTSNDYLRANDFTPEATLTFRVYASEGEADPFLELSLTTDDFGYAFIDGWEHGRDLVVGNYIVASDGTSTRTLVLEPLTVDVFDPATDYVAGTASPGEFVHVVIGNNDVGYPAEMDVYANGEGEWQADFAGIFDIPWDMWGSADVFDEDGDRTVFHLGASPPPSPRFSVFPEWEWIEGFEWPDDVPVYTSVDGKPECDDSASASGGYFHLELGEDCDIVVGDTVRLSDGTTDRMHIVRNLAITATDAEAETVAGTADVGAVVYVWKHEPGEQVAATADASGNWLADLTGFYDIVPGSEGRSEIRDELGNGTAVDWRASNPRFAAFPEWDFIEGWDWPLGALVHLSIDDPATPADPDYVDDQTVGYHPEDPNTVWVGFELGEYDLKPGDVVTVSYGTTSKVLVVANLAVTWFDLAEGFVGGTGSPELDVHIWVHGVDLSFMITTPDEQGDWGVDFDDVGYTVVQGTSGRAEQVDPDSDATAVDWNIPNPTVTVFLEWEAFELWSWPIGTEVVFSIEDPVTDPSPDFQDRYVVPPADWNPEEGYLWIDLAGAFDVKPGDVVTVTGAGLASQHTVRSLTVEAVDANLDTVSGTADPGAVVYVWPHEFGWWTYGLPVVTGEDGDWVAHLGDLPFDLLPGGSGRAEIVDEFGNTTGIDWSAPRPRMSVYLEGEFVIGWDWPHGASVHLTIDDPANGVGVDYQADAPVGPAPFDPDTWWARFDFAGAYDVKPGDIVVLTDGTTVRTHVVYPLTVDAIDGEADTVTGTSDPGATVYVYPWGDYFGPIEADESGNWSMDFTGLYDLVPGTWGTAEVDDEVWNATAIDWTVSLPVLIDIRPWSASNLVLCGTRWSLLPVAVLSADGFDATAVDHDTVRFGRTGVEAEVASLAGRPLRYARDVNGDGLVDMVYSFRFGDTGFSCADIPLGQHSARVEATLSGWMGDIYLEGRDSLTLFRLLGH